MEKEEHTVLWNSLSELDRNNVEKNAHYYLDGYDAPFKLLFRRNEIWMILKNNGEENKNCLNKNPAYFTKFCPSAPSPGDKEGKMK